MIESIAPMLNRATMRGYELRAGVEMFARAANAALSNKKIVIVWTASVPTAAVDAYGQMYLHNFADDAVVTRAMFRKFIGYVVHESLHVAYTDFHAVQRQPYLAKLHNAVEDVWIERKGIKAKIFGNIKATLHGLIAEMAEKALAANVDWSQSCQYPFAFAVFGRGYGGKAIPFPESLRPAFEEASRRIDGCKSSEDTLAVARYLLAAIQQAAAQDAEKQPDEQPEEKQDEKKDEKQDEGQSEGQQGEEQGEGESEGEGQEGPGEGQGEAAGGGEDATPHIGPAQPATANSQSAHAVEVEPGNPMAGQPAAAGSFTNEQGTRARPLLGNARWAANAGVVGKLRYELRKLFEKTAREEFDAGLKAGSLDIRSVHKFGQTDRLFARRDEVDGIDSAVVVVLDASGSMFMGRTPRMETAAPVCATLLATLADAGVDTALLIYGDQTCVAKPFGKNPRAVTGMIQSIENAGNSNDFHAVRTAHGMLLKHRAQRKVVLVLTDGVGDEEATAEQATAGERLGITTIGVGINHDVDNVYRVNVRVDDMASLGSVAFSKLRIAGVR